MRHKTLLLLIFFGLEISAQTTVNIGGTSQTATAFPNANDFFRNKLLWSPLNNDTTIFAVSSAGGAWKTLPIRFGSLSTGGGGGGLSLPLNQIGFGTGTGITSNTSFVINPSETYTGTGTATLGAPRIRVGNGGYAANDDAAVNVGRVISGAGLFSHAFRDESDVTITGGGAYTAFDAAQVYKGSANYNHGYAFQARPIFAGTGTMDNFATMVSVMAVNSGTVTDLNHIRITDRIGAGTVTRQYGIDIAALTSAGENFAIYTRGTTPSYFGGRIQTGGDFISTGNISAANFYTNSDFNSCGLGLGIAPGASGGFFLSVLGHGAGANLTPFSTVHNTFVGALSGNSVTSKNRNTFIGSLTGRFDDVADGVRIGFRAGEGDTRDSMLFVGNSEVRNWIVGDKSLNIGLGTSNPAEKIDVVGNIKASGTIIPGRWTTATRPTPAVNTNPIGFNTTTGKHEGWDGSAWNAFYEIGTTIKASATLDFPSTAVNSNSDLNVTVTGAAVGDVVTVAPALAAISAHSCFTAWVSAANTVTVRFNHYGAGGATNPASGIFNIIVTKF